MAEAPNVTTGATTSREPRPQAVRRRSSGCRICGARLSTRRESKLLRSRTVAGSGVGSGTPAVRTGLRRRLAPAVGGAGFSRVGGRDQGSAAQRALRRRVRQPQRHSQTHSLCDCARERASAPAALREPHCTAPAFPEQLPVAPATRRRRAREPARFVVQRPRQKSCGKSRAAASRCVLCRRL